MYAGADGAKVPPMTTAALLLQKRSRPFGWLAQLPVKADVTSPAMPHGTYGHPTQATLRWA